MPKNKIYLIDYVGQSNDRGEPVGHSLKTLKETMELFENSQKVELIVPQNYEAELSDRKITVPFFLKYYSSINITKFSNRMAGLRGKVRNLFQVFKTGKEGMLWFVHPDFLLFVFLFVYPFRIKNKIVITMYMEGFNPGNTLKERIKNFFFERTIKRVYLIIKNSSKIKISGKEIFCPDYLYKEERYKPFLSKKNDHVLCTGVMNRAKDIVNLVRAWSGFKNILALKISGFFPDKDLYKEIKKYENHRIEINDLYLTKNDYYKNIAGAKFTLLSYKKSKYLRRTSGILLESIFLDTPVIAPHFLLEYTDLPGIGYDRLEDIESIISSVDEKEIKELHKRMKQVREAYDFDKMKQKITAALTALNRK
ncbi:hypothetical protein ACFLRB_04455 [Acidobacteriota bacterium]